jgi:hypothetical protein
MFRTAILRRANTATTGQSRAHQSVIEFPGQVRLLRFWIIQDRRNVQMPEFARQWVCAVVGVYEALCAKKVSEIM